MPLNGEHPWLWRRYRELNGFDQPVFRPCGRHERRGEVAKAYAHMKEALQASRPGLLRREEQQERVTSA